MGIITNGLFNLCNEQNETNIHALSECKHIKTFLDGNGTLDFKYENSRSRLDQIQKIFAKGDLNFK